MASSVIGALRVNLGIDSAAFSNGLKQASTGLQKFGALAKTGLLAVGAAATAAAGAMGYAIKNTIDSADEMSKAASKIGVPIEELSRLKYAADLSGVSFEGLQTAVGRLSRVMNDAKNGSKEAVDTFGQLGISATNVDGTLKSATQVLQEVSDKFATMPDGAEKTALAMELMGRSGANMIPLLNGGSEALAKLTAEADTFGQVFTAEMGSQAEAFNDNISRLQGAFGNIAAELAGRLLPHLERFSEWLVQNAPAIADFVVRMVDAGVQIVQFGASVVQLGIDIANFMSDAWARFEAGWDGMVTKVHAVKDAIVQFAAELLQAFMALPGQMLEIGGQIIQGLWDGLKGKMGQVKEYLTNSVSGMVDSVKGALGIRSPSKVMHEVGVNVMQGLSGGMESMAGGIETLASNIGSTIGNAFASVIDGSKTVKEALADVLKQLGSMLLNKAFAGLGSIGGGGGFLSALFGGLLGFANGGTILPGGAGGVDSQVVAFRKSPSEQVDIYNPRTQGRSGGGFVYAPVIHAQNSDAAAIAGLRRQVEEQGRNFGKMVDARGHTRELRGTRG